MRQSLFLYWLTDEHQHLPTLAKLTDFSYLVSAMNCPLELPHIHIWNILVTSGKGQGLNSYKHCYYGTHWSCYAYLSVFSIKQSVLKVMIVSHLLLYPLCLTECLAHKEFQYDFPNVDNKREKIYNLTVNLKQWFQKQGNSKVQTEGRPLCTHMKVPDDEIQVSFLH